MMKARNIINSQYSHSRTCNLTAHTIMLWTMNTIILQLLNQLKKLVPFGAITWSSESRKLWLAIYLVTIEDASDLENRHIEHGQCTMQMYLGLTAVAARDRVPFRTQCLNSSGWRFPIQLLWPYKKTWSSSWIAGWPKLSVWSFKGKRRMK